MQLPPSAAPRAAYAADRVPDTVRSRLGALVDPACPLGAYVYDPAVASQAAARLRAVLPAWAEVFYAVKANAFAPVLEALATGGVHGYEVASVREADAAVSAAARVGIRPRLVASGPAKSEPLLAALLAAGVEFVNVESALELHRLSQLAAASGRRVPVTLRINPATVSIRGSLLLGGAPTQFGIPEADVPAAIELARRLPGVELVGFHVHAVCQNLDAEAHADYVRWCLEYSTRTAAEHQVGLRTVDAGGGLGVAFDGEEPFDIERFGEALGRLHPPAGVTVVFEPGRWLVTHCGWYAAEVLDVKRAYGRWFAVLRGGINHFQLPTSWDIVHRFAVLPVDDWPHPWPRPGVRGDTVTVVGELCTTEDTLARDVHVAELRAGDIVAFPMAGSYGWEFAMHAFLGHPPAVRVLV